MGLARYQTPEWKDQLPPKLMGEGRGSIPDWLLQFLANPALDPKDTDRDGVRSYLKVRMPTFYFSPIELRKLVRFFQALSQTSPCLTFRPSRCRLTDQEIAMARALFTSKAAPCLKCHATGDPAARQVATAPNFLLAKERLKPDWVERWIRDPQAISPALDAVGLVPDGQRPLGLRRPHAAIVPGLRQRPYEAAGRLHFPVNTGRAAASSSLDGTRAGSTPARGSAEASLQCEKLGRWRRIAVKCAGSRPHARNDATDLPGLRRSRYTGLPV